MAILIGRGLSALIAVVYLIFAFLGGGPATLLTVAVFLLLPMACIWFPEELASVPHVKGMPMNETPGCFVAGGGWLLLMLPMILTVVNYFRGVQ